MGLVEDARASDGGGDESCQCLQHRDVIVIEDVRLIRQDLQHPDRGAVVLQRDHDHGSGADAAGGFPVHAVVRFGVVADQNVAGPNAQTGQARVQRQAHPFGPAD